MITYKEENIFRKLRHELDTDEKDCSQIDLSKLLLISPKRISVIETSPPGKTPSITEMQAYHRVFNVPYEYMLGESNSRYYENQIISSELGLSDEAIKQLKDWQEVIGNNFLIKGEAPPENSLRLILDGFSFMQQATINLLLTNKTGKLLLDFLSDYIYSDYVSYEEEPTKVALYNKNTDCKTYFDVKHIKATQLLNIQKILLKIEEEINPREENQDGNSNTKKE